MNISDKKIKSLTTRNLSLSLKMNKSERKLVPTTDVVFNWDQKYVCQGGNDVQPIHAGRSDYIFLESSLIILCYLNHSQRRINIFFQISKSA